MARRGSGPLFLGRAGYRRRRLSDAARLLPLFGAFLVLLPILWEPAASDQRNTVPDGIYLFAVWLGLIGGAAVLAPRLAATPPPDDPDPPHDAVRDPVREQG